MDNFDFIVTIISCLSITFCVVMMIKNEITYKNYSIISSAIYHYNVDRIEHFEFSKKIEFERMRSYWKTLFRFWDWGYKHIVPPEIFEVIKPYINK